MVLFPNCCRPVRGIFILVESPNPNGHPVLTCETMKLTSRRYYIFGPYMALTVAATTITYLWISIYLVAKETAPRRRYRGLQQKESQLMYDTVGGWSSVSHFNRHAYEKTRYAAAVNITMVWDRKLQLLYQYFGFTQDIVLQLGFIIAGQYYSMVKTYSTWRFIWTSSLEPVPRVLTVIFRTPSLVPEHFVYSQFLG